MMMTTTTVTCGLVVKRPSFTFTPLKDSRLRNREKTSIGNVSPETVTMKGHRFIIILDNIIKISNVLFHYDIYVVFYIVTCEINPIYT